MAEHENSIGASDDWHTPPDLLAAIGLKYDLDPCAPVDWRRQQQRGTYHVTARNHYTAEDDGLAQPWAGLVFVNPPFGGRLGHVPWLEKFIEHGNGILVCRAYTLAGWWHDWIPRTDGILFPRGKTKFQRPDGTIGGSPGHGITLVGMGATACRALRDSGLGIYFAVGLILVPRAEPLPQPKLARCAGCAGTGYSDIANGVACKVCNGRGVFYTPTSTGTNSTPQRHLAGAAIQTPTKPKGQPCGFCYGKGYLGTVWDCDKCTQCDGAGYLLTPPTIQDGGSHGG